MVNHLKLTRTNIELTKENGHRVFCFSAHPSSNVAKGPADLRAPCLQAFGVNPPRSPSSALLPVFGGGFPY